MTIVLIDNYDSFTWNLAHQTARVIGSMPIVVRNDQITLQDMANIKPQAVLISPGPGKPYESGICLPLIEWLAERHIPMFGVCLGMQSLAAAYGAKIVNAPVVAHGKVSMIHHFGDTIFDSISSPFAAARYHSLVVDRATLSDVFAVTAKGPDDVIMAIRHKSLPLHGVQFHTESCASPSGTQILSNFFLQATSIPLCESFAAKFRTPITSSSSHANPDFS